MDAEYDVRGQLARRDDGDWADRSGMVEPSWLPDSPRKPHIVVFANEKGGVGKSTVAFHTCIALCNAGERVAVFDLDFRQRSLSRAIEKRISTASRLNVDLPIPVHEMSLPLTGEGLANEIRCIRRSCTFILIDVAGHDSDLAHHAIAMADTLVTPINDSFVDLELLGHVDAENMQSTVLGPFARLVQHLAAGIQVGKAKGMDWVVLQNRLRQFRTRNGTRFNAVLDSIADAAGFRTISGLSERVIYRELYPFGLTLLDLARIPEFAQVRPEAEAELKQMLSALRLPITVPNPAGAAD